MSSVVISGDTSGTATLTVAAVAGTPTLTLPTTTDTLVGKATTDTLTNKTLTSPTITGVATFDAGTALLPALTTTGDTNTGVWFPAADTVAASTAGTERMRIDSSGNVGIGTTAPSQKLEVYAASNSLQIESVVRNDQAGSGVAAVGFNVSSGAAAETTSTKAGIGLVRTNAYGVGSLCFYNNGTGSAGNFTTADERMRIDSSGNVGIGTTSPANKLDVTGTIGAINVSSSTGTNYAKVQVNNTGGSFQFGIENSAGGNYGAPAYSRVLWNDGAYPNVFYTNSTERMRIDSSGDVMIGGTTVTASARLNVYQADSSLRVVHFENTRNISGDENLRVALGTNCNNTSSYQFIATTGGTDKLYIYGNGNVVNTNNSYGALSDIKLKENIVDATPKLADLMQVRVRNYNLIGDSTKQIGVVAQELETIFPAMVDESPDRDGEGGNLDTVTKSVKYSVFVPMLIKAIQEQQAMLASLKAIIDTQAARITALESV